MPRAIVLVFTAAVAANAALLFAVQPLVSRLVLPLLGGSPAVWGTCLVFFQGLLLAGYAYAHLSARALAPGAQALAHLTLAALSLLALPIALPGGWPPPVGGDATTTRWLLLVLLAVGAPFFVLAAGAPLLQHWFARATRDTRDPYPLYAASNAGSLLALVAYPFAIEPWLSLARQGRWWGVAYAIAALLTATCAWLMWRAGAARESPLAARDADGVGHHGAAITARRRLYWTLLAAAPSMLLVGVTRYVTTDLAPVPLLWVVPLALYLLTFVNAFAARPLVPRTPALHAQAALVAVLATLLSAEVRTIGGLALLLHLATFTLCALVGHRTLADLRPPPARLTEYYLWISLGGFLGGVAAALVAPALFATLAEYPIALALAVALRPPYPRAPAAVPRRVFARLTHLARNDATPPSPRRRLLSRVVVPLAAGLLGYCAAAAPDAGPAMLRAIPSTAFAVAAALILFLARRDRVAFAFGVAALLLAGEAGRRAREGDVLLRARSFFGTYVVRRAGTYHHLAHGSTLHGAQDMRPRYRTTPLTYYHRAGPLVRLFATLPAGNGRRVAAVGLGTGAAACLGAPDERWTFYEIDPLVARIARDARWFTYLRDCPPASTVVLGDARLRLADAPAATYDAIVLDAFSSDAVPVHLLTREALALYLDALAPGGVIAVHVSNRHLDLREPLGALARDAGLVGLVGEDVSRAARTHPFITPSVWIVLARRPADLAGVAGRRGWTRLAADPAIAPWTDDWSNVLGAMRW